VEAVEKKVLDNLPGLAGMYMMQQQSLLSVMSLQGIVPVQQQMQAQVPLPQMMGMQMSGQGETSVEEQEQGSAVMVSGDTRDNRNYTEEDVKKYEMEPELNELLDFTFCGD
jgi:hypothetical protein